MGKRKFLMSDLKLFRSLTGAVICLIFLTQRLKSLECLLGGFYLPKALAFSWVLEPDLLAPFIYHCDVTVIGTSE